LSKRAFSARASQLESWALGVTAQETSGSSDRGAGEGRGTLVSRVAARSERSSCWMTESPEEKSELHQLERG